MAFANRAALGILGAGAAGGMYFGTGQAPADATESEKLSIGTFTAGAGAAVTGAGLLAHKAGVFKPAAKMAFSTGSKFATTKTGMFVGGGAAIGAAVGAYTSDDKVSGGTKGAAIGAGAGLATRAAMFAAVAKGGKSYGKFAGKSAIASAALLATLAVGGGIHALTHTPGTGSYSSMGDGGETEYSDSPLKRRSQAMNATGSVVLGLHRKRRG